jgi:hypothetical protein
LVFDGLIMHYALKIPSKASLFLVFLEEIGAKCE